MNNTVIIVVTRRSFECSCYVEFSYYESKSVYNYLWNLGSLTVAILSYASFEYISVSCQSVSSSWNFLELTEVSKQRHYMMNLVLL